MPTTETTTPPPPDSPTAPPARSGARLARIIALLVLVLLIALAATALLFTERGNTLLNNPHQVRGEVVNFVHHHPFTAPLVYVATYVFMGLLALPLWWLQILAGYAFGLPLGVVYSQTASVIGAVTSARFSHWLAADWFHKLESRLA